MKIYIGNLPVQVTDAQLHDLALPYGKPDSANIARTLVGGASKGFGFVEYRTDAEAKAAIAGLNGKKVLGQALTAFDANALNAKLWSAAGRR